jgi:hypothetical protein
MNRAALVEMLRTYEAALRDGGATGLFIFGSRAAILTSSSITIPS